MNQCLRKPDALQHPFRIRAQPAVARPVQPHKIEQFVDALLQWRACHSAQPSEETQGFLTGEIFVEIRVLGEKPYCFAAFDQATVPSKDFRSAARWRHQAKNDFQCGAFP